MEYSNIFVKTLTQIPTIWKLSELIILKCFVLSFLLVCSLCVCACACFSSINCGHTAIPSTYIHSETFIE